MEPKSISRTPPVDIRRQLRAEVGFGCPMCGSPHLEYHHFDPPWSKQQNHHPSGMIALCAQHHAAADAGAFTLEQLVDFKRSGQSSVRSSFQWRRKHTVFVCGGNYAYQCGTMLRVGGMDIIYFEKDENGFDTLSLNIYDVCMNRILIMRKNDWIARTNVDDIETPPSSRTLSFKSSIHRVTVIIEFKDRANIDSNDLLIASQFGIPENENVVFCTFHGNLPAPVPATFNKQSIQIGGMTLGGNRMSRVEVGIQLG